MIILEKQGKRNIAMRLAYRAGVYHPSQLQEQKIVYDSIMEFKLAEE